MHHAEQGNACPRRWFFWHCDPALAGARWRERRARRLAYTLKRDAVPDVPPIAPRERVLCMIAALVLRLCLSFLVLGTAVALSPP